MRDRSGFAFVDLVIVTAVVAGIAGVSIAPVLAGGRLANERAAVNSLKAITIWKYVLPATYTATFAGSAGAATDSTSTTAGAGLAPEFTLAAAAGQGTFPAAPASIGCSRDKPEPQPDWDAVLKGAAHSLSDAIDKGLKELGEGTVFLAEIEPDGGKPVCAMDIAKGKEVVAATLDLKNGKVLAKETAADDQSPLVKGFKVTAKAAIEAALKEASGQAVAVELVTFKGRPVIRVRIWSKGKLRVAAVNGEDGTVIAVGDAHSSW